jgi:hypothetical protein
MKLATLSWLPNIFGGLVPEAIRQDYIPSKIIDLLKDYLFVRTGGYFFTIFFVVLFVFAVLKILSIPEVNRFKSVRMWCQEVIEDRWKLSLPIQFFNVLYAPIIYYFLLNILDYSHINNPGEIASIILSWLAFIVFVGILLVSFIKVINFFRQYPKLSTNITKAADIILQ